MPITENELRQANQKMLHNTNRGILFATINVSKNAARLEEMLVKYQAGLYTWEALNARIHDQLVVKSFPEFITKFQPLLMHAPMSRL